MTRYRLEGQVEPLNFLFSNQPTADREAVYRERFPGIVFPVVVYRYEVSSGSDPVSNDVVQVTPLMEEIAFQHTVDPTSVPVTIVHDPFVGMYNSPTPNTRNIFLLDRQPVISGAKYRYIIVRLDDVTKEIDRVMLTNEVTIP